MKIKTLAITTGVAAALAMGLYLGSGAQAGTCTIGSDTGPGVPVRLAAQSQAKPSSEKPSGNQGNAQASGQTAGQQQGTEDKDKGEAQPKGAAPIVPIIAPDEGC
ncbi:MAG: hypothetical protein KQI62_13995 [Deltaproteobacteria bacterium]|nr:hypothetical protein [Deltaproteobacteria bacterium]